MPAAATLLPSRPVPQLQLSDINGESWDSTAATGDNFSLIVFYRGLHCPVCKTQLLDLQNALPGFDDLGVSVTAVSMDPDDRLQRTIEEWGIDKLRLINGLTANQARQWGLFLSNGRGKTSIGIEEPELFNEPGTFLVKPNGTLFASWIQTVPPGRPQAESLQSFIRFVRDKDYPPRGTAVAA